MARRPTAHTPLPKRAPSTGRPSQPGTKPGQGAPARGPFPTKVTVPNKMKRGPKG